LQHQSTHPGEELLLVAENKPTTAQMHPGDQAPPGTPGTGENICPKCGRTGALGGTNCEHCGGTGKVTEEVGGA
jgi:hypothetical protein